MRPSVEHVRAASRILQPVISPSPLIHSRILSRDVGAQVFLKLENLQETGSFKVRGAYYRLSCLKEQERKLGVIAASAGNHAQGVAWAASRLGINATIVMPEDVSLRKLMAVKEYGPEIVLHGVFYDDAFAHAVEISKETGKILVSAFDDPYVIAGQGTIGLELEHELEDDTVIVVPIGGGGLISGISLATKALNPRIRIVGVQAENCPSAIRSLEESRPTFAEASPTLADGIAVKKPGKLTFPIIQELVDEIVAVDEEAIAGAILSLIDRASLVAEGAGAVPLAALMENKLHTTAERYILILSGGNIETNTIDRILQRGAIRMGRLIRIEVNLPDIPGALWNLLGIVANEKANILHIVHDRLALQNPIQVSRVELNLETRGPDHAQEVIDRMLRSGYRVQRIL